MKIKVLLISFLYIIVTKVVVSQTITDCLNDFDFVVATIKDDYPGYHDKVNDDNISKLTILENEIRQKITKQPDSCWFYLSEYTRFFKDFHLGIISHQTNYKSDLMEVSTYGKNVYVNIDSLHQATKNSNGIEGVWEGYREKLVIFKDDQKYIGVVINSFIWKSNQVKYEFIPVNDTLFELINHALLKDSKIFKTKASLHLDGKVIEIHDNTKFVRKSDSEIYDKAILSSYCQTFPNGRNVFPVAMYLSDNTFYLRITDFNSSLANDFVKKHWDEIMSRPNLIIDIRNNRGGQDPYYSELAKIIYTKPFERKGVEWYATKGRIERKESDIEKGNVSGGEEGLKWAQALIEEMKTNVGGFVTHPDNKSDYNMVIRSTVYSMPRNVGIIINESNASSAEQFLLTAKESDKVILFGNRNTAGVLDYSNAVYIRLPSNNFSLLCPETRSKRLPENPIDNIGIAPDIIIPFPATEQLFNRLDDWVYFVKEYLEILDSVK